ncbi:A24 family peptidase [Allorhodopirellula solitaria]|uniref:Type IV leader peptidase family protein n=1 Tax=Allorhodopirellula solitaria TaxID=2527987 RepID=A0A5C5YE61_9BACT|nr:prepilin peptidase [Allorhodopirellula solitaria]TWT73324.1 Type IV leader peptidase family protein [Allorhodopirellula solitaria]
MLILTLTVTFVLLLVATVCDYRSREIPDWISIGIAIVAVIASSAGWLGIGLPWVIFGGVVGLLIGYGLFRFAQLGGGDAKLIAALGMTFGPVGILILLFGMAIIGGVLSLIAMLRGQRDYAYVPAITGGFIWYVSVVSLI